MHPRDFDAEALDEAEDSLDLELPVDVVLDLYTPLAGLHERSSRAHRVLYELCAGRTPHGELSEVLQAAADALDPERLQGAAQNRALATADSSFESVAEKLEAMAFLADEFGHWLATDWEALGRKDCAALCAVLLMRRAVSTAQAIALLLRHGFTTDAQARWRALHEVAVTAAAIAYGPHVGVVAERYSAHAGLLKRGHPALDHVTMEDKFSADYEWARPLFPTRDGRNPQRISHRSLTNLVQLSSCDFEEYLSWGNHATHASSALAGELWWEQGPLPFGSQPDDCPTIGVISRRALYETACYCAFLALYDLRRKHRNAPLAACTVWLDILSHHANIAPAMPSAG